MSNFYKTPPGVKLLLIIIFLKKISVVNVGTNEKDIRKKSNVTRIQNSLEGRFYLLILHIISIQIIGCAYGHTVRRITLFV